MALIYVDLMRAAEASAQILKNGNQTDEKNRPLLQRYPSSFTDMLWVGC
jgi:hypothetical protein